MDNFYIHSVVITRKSINATTRKDESTTIATLNGLIQPESNTSQVTVISEIGKGYILFLPITTAIRVGDMVAYGTVNFSLDSIQERVDHLGLDNFYSCRITKRNTSNLIL